MTGPGKEWVIVVVFFAAFVAVTLAELYWLSQRKAVPLRQAMMVVLSSNFLTITVGFLVSFLIFGLLLAAASREGGQMPLDNLRTWGSFAAALAFPFLLMAGAKRGLILLLRFEQIRRPVSYSLISALIFFGAVIGIPAVFLIIF